MEGRNYIPPSALQLGQNHRPLIESSLPPHYFIGDRTAVQKREEIQSLLLENRRLAALHELLKQDLSAAQQELRHLSSTAEKAKAERDAQVREVYDMAMKKEAEIRSIDESSAELSKALADLQKLRSDRKELDEKLNKLRGEVMNSKATFEWHQIPLMKDEIEAMQNDIQRGRAIIEHEKRVCATNNEQCQTMEKCRNSMAREIEKLKVEAVDAAKRARAAAAAEGVSYPGTGYWNPETRYAAPPASS